MRTSYSALETYRLCPQKYKFQELDRVPAKKSRAALFGTHLHSCLKFMFSPGPLFPTVDEVIGHFRDAFPPQEKMELAPEEKQLYLEEGERMLKNFYAENPPWNFSVVDLESRFEVLIEDPRQREVHVLAGRIDRIDKIENGYEIIDYKTSRRMPSQEAVDRDLQMSIYSLGLQKRWPHVKPDEITLSLYFLKHGEKLSTTRTAEATASTGREVLGTISEIRHKLSTGERFEPTPGPHCGFCPYKPICPAWRHLYRDQKAGSKRQGEIDAVLKEYFSLLKNQQQNETRLAELKANIRAYMESEGYERIFGEEGYVSRSVQKRYAYDFGRVREILEPIGKWEAILAADEKKLKTILKNLPHEIQSQVEEAKVLTREFTVISVSTKKIPRPPADEYPQANEASRPPSA